MSWFGKVTFGTLGLFLGGPLGAVLGAALGHNLVDKNGGGGRPQAELGRSEQAQAAYFVCMFSILGKLAKVDGVVTRAELAAVDSFIATMNIAENEKQFARQIFNEAKHSPYAIEDFAQQFHDISRGQQAVLSSFLEVLFRVAAADGALHPAEESALRTVQRVFGISDRRFNDIRAVYADDIDKYYKRLNCTPGSSVEEIKSSYKKLVKDFHPDTIIAKGLPEEFIDFAATRFREIQEAYEKIRKEKGF
jgi:DnaJ like chaperone protein